MVDDRRSDSFTATRDPAWNRFVGNELARLAKFATFEPVPDNFLTRTSANLSTNLATTLAAPGTYALFTSRARGLFLPNNEAVGDKGRQARLIGLLGTQPNGQRPDVRQSSPNPPGLRIELVSETPMAPGLWLWCIAAEWPQRLTQPVETSIVGVTTTAAANLPAGSVCTLPLRVIVSPESAIGAGLPPQAGGTREQTVEAIMSECERQRVMLDTQVAYLLATCEHECGFRPIREGQWGGRTAEASETYRRRLRYYPYYGRGYVQLTHKGNYRNYADRLGIDLVNDPDLALDPRVALSVLVHGVTNGMFGPSMISFIHERRTDFFNARRSVNVVDRAQHIAGMAQRWLTWISANHPTRFRPGFGAPRARPAAPAPHGRRP